MEFYNASIEDYYNLLYNDYKQTIKAILEKHNFIVSENYKDEYDFNIQFGEKIGICELKLYRETYPSFQQLQLASKMLRSQLKSGEKTLLIIVNVEVAETLKSEIFSLFGVQIWDIYELTALSAEFPILFQRLDLIINKILPIDVQYISFKNDLESENIISEFWNKSSWVEKIDIVKEAESKFAKIFGIKTGKDFVKYEDYCSDLLYFLFSKDLDLWKKQLPSDENLKRYDLICRINSKNSFWNNLSKDFNSRYIVFEFKNYSAKIKQNQIYTTEKYLYTKALRSICFLISRKGPDLNAMKAAKGVLKETGKLIVCLSDIHLKKMSIEMDKGNSPENILIEFIDDMLIKINS